ncbi:hypothetical protein J437_LFUL014614 [Ladona fulva]|uniref:Protein LTV1 homolog n=1 Tax=Ladona fulva TaxID=123851 RepID=A0A8K0P5D6_LADFU|nr:hypothetical protein J437_LFUL014614 [Ladona fulva]
MCHQLPDKMPKKKKFIDKKNSVTFHLVHRSQKDPLAADERAPQHVLVPLGKKVDQKEKEPEKRIEEQRKYGIFFDDDYNYLQHLRGVNQTSVEWETVETFRIPKDEKILPSSSEKDQKKITLPSSVFASSVEENVGLLNKAAPHSGPRLDLDPDVVAAMDDDFDFDDPDNMLEDDFIVMANASGSENEEEDEGSDDVGSEDGFGNASWDEEDDELGSLNGPCPFAEEETKSRFTEYSMSSSVIRRNNQLTLLDDRFEKMFESYNDNEIGALECEEIEGDLPMDAGILAQCADEFEQERARIALKEARKEAHGEDGVGVKEEEESNSDDEEMETIDVPDKDDKRWDCESILSTYSNLYNHPKLIKDDFGRPGAIKVSSKTGVPLGVLRDGRNAGLTAKGLAALDRAFAAERGDDAETVATSVISQLSIRPKDETPEDRRQRKQALKNYRKERRIERKANTLAFKEEKKRQEKTLLSNKQNIFNVKVV